MRQKVDEFRHEQRANEKAFAKKEKARARLEAEEDARNRAKCEAVRKVNQEAEDRELAKQRAELAAQEQQQQQPRETPENQVSGKEMTRAQDDEEKRAREKAAIQKLREVHEIYLQKSLELARSRAQKVADDVAAMNCARAKALVKHIVSSPSEKRKAEEADGEEHLLKKLRTTKEIDGENHVVSMVTKRVAEEAVDKGRLLKKCKAADATRYIPSPVQSLNPLTPSSLDSGYSAQPPNLVTNSDIKTEDCPDRDDNTQMEDSLPQTAELVSNFDTNIENCPVPVSHPTPFPLPVVNVALDIEIEDAPAEPVNLSVSESASFPSQSHASDIQIHEAIPDDLQQPASLPDQSFGSDINIQDAVQEPAPAPEQQVLEPTTLPAQSEVPAVDMPNADAVPTKQIGKPIATSSNTANTVLQTGDQIERYSFPNVSQITVQAVVAGPSNPCTVSAPASDSTEVKKDSKGTSAPPKQAGGKKMRVTRGRKLPVPVSVQALEEEEDSGPVKPFKGSAKGKDKGKEPVRSGDAPGSTADSTVAGSATKSAALPETKKPIKKVMMGRKIIQPRGRKTVGGELSAEDKALEEWWDENKI
jgi:hypothetical protein